MKHKQHPTARKRECLAMLKKNKRVKVTLKTLTEMFWITLTVIAVFALSIWVLGMKVMSDAIGMTGAIKGLFK